MVLNCTMHKVRAVLPRYKIRKPVFALEVGGHNKPSTTNERVL